MLQQLLEPEKINENNSTKHKSHQKNSKLIRVYKSFLSFVD